MDNFLLPLFMKINKMEKIIRCRIVLLNHDDHRKFQRLKYLHIRIIEITVRIKRIARIIIINL